MAGTRGRLHRNTQLGRFVSADTIVPEAGNPQDFNRYAYVRNNPLNYRDPSGHAPDPGMGTIWDERPPDEDPSSDWDSCARWNRQRAFYARTTWGAGHPAIAGHTAEANLAMLNYTAHHGGIPPEVFAHLLYGGISQMGHVYNATISGHIYAPVTTSYPDGPWGNFQTPRDAATAPRPQTVWQPHVDTSTGEVMVIDTSTFPYGESTSGGGIRESRLFWKRWAAEYPHTLSPENRYAITVERLSPQVDEVWSRYYPEHAYYSGETLAHHHWNYGSLAFPVPYTPHQLQPGTGILHP